MTSLVQPRVWYDVFANFYDASLDGVYREHRRQTVQAMKIEPGMTVVDVGCGTGAFLPFLVEAVGPTGRVIGADISSGMLRKARARVARQGWANVTLMEIDARSSSKELAEKIGKIDRVVCFLSLSVIDTWSDVLRLWFDALSAGGLLAIADVHNPKPNLHARFVEWISRGTLTRKSWEPLQAMSSSFELAWQPSSWTLGGKFFVATGTR